MYVHVYSTDWNYPRPVSGTMQQHKQDVQYMLAPFRETHCHEIAAF